MLVLNTKLSEYKSSLYETCRTLLTADQKKPTKSSNSPAKSSVHVARTISQVRQALAAHDPELRAIFTLKEENGLSYQEIAATLGILEGTVGSRLNRARRELRKFLS